ncbi:unnamed protein product [Lathyrus oleraceus]
MQSGGPYAVLRFQPLFTETRRPSTYQVEAPNPILRRNKLIKNKKIEVDSCCSHTNRIKYSNKSGMNSMTTHTIAPESIIVTGRNNLPVMVKGEDLSATSDSNLVNEANDALLGEFAKMMMKMDGQDLVRPMAVVQL